MKIPPRLFCIDKQRKVLNRDIGNIYEFKRNFSTHLFPW